MKALILLSALIPAGIIASFFGSSNPRQDEVEQADESPKILTVVRGVDGPHVSATGGGGVSYRFDQEASGDERRVTIVQSAPPVPGVASVPIRAAIATTSPDGMIVVGGASSDKELKVVEKLSQAKTDEEKEAARDELENVLSDAFDTYIERQGKELDRLEARVKKLREQLDKRREAKDEVVGLRLKQRVNEAEGKGWPSGELDGWDEPFSGNFHFSPGANWAALTPVPGVPPAAALAPMGINIEAEVTTDNESEDEEPAEPSGSKRPRQRKR